MRNLNEYKHNKHSAVYEFQKLKDRLNLTEEEENRIQFSPKKVYGKTPKTERNMEDKCGII